MKTSSAETAGARRRVLIFIPAYQAETTIASVVGRIPEILNDRYDTDILIADDCSQDLTFVKGLQAARADGTHFQTRVLYNPANLGYGGNQKLGYRYAVEKEYDLVAMLHGDGQYAPEYLPFLLEAFADREVAAVFGSRMLTRGSARRGGMPFYKFVGNKTLTWIQNRLLGSSLSEFHSGYRIYSVKALKRIPFEKNSNGFDFDTEIIIQFLTAKLKIVERPVPTFYGDEICRVEGFRYARDVIRATLLSRVQKLGLFYDPRFDCAPTPGEDARPVCRTPASMAKERIPPGARVLDVAPGGAVLRQVPERRSDRHSEPDVVLCLDAIDCMASPEEFLCRLRESLARTPAATIFLSAANVAFIVTRMMLLLGQFNYGRRGILDLKHTRLFTFASLRRCLEQAGFEVVDMSGVPAPYALALGDNFVSRTLVTLNEWLIRISRGLFSYQMFVEARSLPTVSSLLESAFRESALRAGSLKHDSMRVI